MSDDEFLRPHEWAMEEDGSLKYIELGENHGGPLCITCALAFCQHCKPDINVQPCENQDEILFPTAFTKTQLDARLRRLNKLGYILKAGEIVGWREPPKKCKPDAHKWTIKSRTIIGEGMFRRAHTILSCVVCDTEAIG